MTGYVDWLGEKHATAVDGGVQVPPDDLPEFLFGFQRDVVSWALARGRAAIFAGTGLGKTAMELAWASRAGRRVLILAPLAVSRQIAREAEKFGIPAKVAQDGINAPRTGIVITNYERLERFHPSQFDAIVLDESSVLKSFDGKTRRLLTEFAASLPMRLCATATPAPNDWTELGTHAEFLGAMTNQEMLSLYFTQDGNSTQKWRLKGHAAEDYWSWVATWAVAFNRPGQVDHSEDDERFELPPLRVSPHVLPDQTGFAAGTLFATEARTLTERRNARRASLADRVAHAVGLVAAEPDEQWLLWCDLNDESSALARAIPGAVEVRGSDTAEHKESALVGFADGTVRVLVTKPSIAGFGMNWQGCARMAFVGLSDSFERYYQAVRRCWRFGQTRPVEVHVITSEAEGEVARNIERKQQKMETMMDGIVASMAERTREHLRRAQMTYEHDEASGDGWRLLLGDCVERVGELEPDSVGLSVFSPPFPSMYVYTNSPRDMGNVRDVEQMIEHYSYLLPPLYRAMMPGRSVAVHLTQAMTRKRDGDEVGLRDFRGATIAAMEAAGFTYYGEVAIDKDPQVKAIRTKDRGLLFKTLAADSAHMRMALADYLLQFRKPGENPHPIRAGISERYGNEDGWITPEEWIEWAAPVWYRATSDYPGGIRETDVLNVAIAREGKDERHLCPLQLGVIERAIKLWSAPGETVLSPFAGVGSEGYVARQFGREFVGVELKRSYWEVAARNIAQAQPLQPSLLSCAVEEVAG